MTELELLKELNRIERDLLELEWFIKYRPENNEKKQEANALLSKKKDIEIQLIKVADKGNSNRAVKGMIRQLNQYISEISNARPGLKLLRNQGLVLDNYLFSIILRDLHWFLEGEWGGVRIPDNLYYTYGDEPSVETSELIAFFKAEIGHINNLPSINYVLLKEYYEDFTARIVEEFIHKP